MSAKNQFDWISFYEEFADKLLAYKDNRQELIEKIKVVKLQLSQVRTVNAPAGQ